MASGLQCLACCLCVILIISWGLYGGSFKTISPLEAGLKINKASSSIDTSKVYTSGRYLIGLGNDFVTYPTTIQTIGFGTDYPTLTANTADGQQVFVDVSFMYRLSIESIGLLYRKYVTNYKTSYASIAEATIKNALNQFKTPDFYTLRNKIQLAIHTALKSRLETEFAIVVYTQMRRVALPSQTENSIVIKSVTEQTTLTAIAAQQVQLINSNNNVIQTQADQTVRVIQANAQSQATILIDQTRARGIQLVLNATAQAYQNLKTTLNYTNQDLLTHIWIESVRRLNSSNSVTIDLGSALVNV